MDGNDAFAFQVMRVTAATRDTNDTFSLELDGGFPFLPGQFNMLYAFGTGEVPISISGDPSNPGRLVHTIRRVGATTEALCRLNSGDSVGVRGPYGTAWPVSVAAGKHLLIVAGGIGLAPLRPVVYEALRNRDRFRSVALLYGARTPADLLFAPELEKWRDRTDFDCRVTVDRGDPGWHGNTGVVTTLIDARTIDPENTVAMICGPEVMMRFAARNLRQRRMAASDIYLSEERNMKCGIGVCGHCQLGPLLLCKHGPVLTYERLEPLLLVREL